MVKRAFIIGLLSSLVACLGANAQVIDNCPYSPGHKNSLSCLIPDLTKTGTSTNLSNFNTTLAQVIGQLPLAVPVSGFVLGFDKKLGIPVELNENLGSVLTERGNTVGKHKVFLGFTFQRFVFQTIDNTKLSQLPVVFNNGSTFGYSANAVSANINQYTGIIAFGLTSRMDISATLPYERISMSAGNDFRETVTGATTFSNPISQAVAGSAKGVGDLLLNLKVTMLEGEKIAFAGGVEARFPTGNEYNLLGSGAYGVKPYLVLSRRGRFTPHVNVGYQWNDFSNLYINPCYFRPTSDPTSCQGGSGLPTLELPHSLDYSAGADVGLMKRLTFVGDLVGQRFYNAPRITPAGPSTLPNLPPAFTQNPQFNNSVGVKNGDYYMTNVGLGLKWNPIAHLIVSANALVRVDSGGLRPARFVPLGGISYIGSNPLCSCIKLEYTCTPFGMSYESLGAHFTEGAELTWEIHG
jgi:hypothetical protein